MARASVGKGLKVRRVMSREDRQRPSVFMRLKTDESFAAYALFDPNPELEDNAGYFEHYTHNDQQAKRYVPCAGENCPFCAANDNPGTRALTAWYFPDKDKGDQIKLFEVNWGTIQALDDESEDEDGILGKKLRIKRLDDKGQYRVKVISGRADSKPLTKAELKKVMAELEEKFDLPGIVEKRLRAELERMQAQDALEDDDDDEDEDEEPTPAKAKRTGKARVAEPDEDEDEDENEEDEDEDEDESEEDEDEDEDTEEDEESDEDEDESEEEEQVLSGNFTVSRVANEEDGILNFTNDDGDKFKMYVAEDVEVDYDEVKKGVEVTLSAEQDEEGDWIITEIELAEKPMTRKPRGRAARK